MQLSIFDSVSELFQNKYERKPALLAGFFFFCLAGCAGGCKRLRAAFVSFWETISAMWDDRRQTNSRVSSWSSGVSTRSKLGCITRIECRVAEPPCCSRRLILPTISVVVAVALRSSFFTPRPNCKKVFFWVSFGG